MEERHVEDGLGRHPPEKTPWTYPSGEESMIRFLLLLSALAALGHADCLSRGKLTFATSQVTLAAIGRHITTQETARNVARVLEAVPPVFSQTRTPAVDLTVPELVFRYAMYSALAYFPTALDVERFAAVPGMYTGRYQLLSKPSLDGIKTVFNGLEASYTLVVNHEQKNIVLAWRGSNDVEDFIAGTIAFRYVQVSPMFYDPKVCAPLPGRGPMRISDGFQQTMSQQVLASMTADVEAAWQPGYDFILVGHSLGGAKALLSAIYFRLYTSIPVAAVYAYGLPLLGTTAYTEWLAACLGPDRLVRIVSSNDIVPWMGADLDNRLHPGNVAEVYFSDPFVPAYRVCLGGAGVGCSRETPCEEKDWLHHSDFGGLRISKSLALLGAAAVGAPERENLAEKMRLGQILQISDGI
ncbi:MAG: hypothetical protein SGCHY_004739 [Lobulomycetales sp.]